MDQNPPGGAETRSHHPQQRKPQRAQKKSDRKSKSKSKSKIYAQMTLKKSDDADLIVDEEKVLVCYCRPMSRAEYIER